VRNIFAGDPPPNGLHDRLEPGIRAIAFPSPQRDCLNLTKAKWRFDQIQADRQIGATLARTAGLVADEIALWPYGAFAPYHDDAFGGV
jgi:hypothetical protein